MTRLRTASILFICITIVPPAKCSLLRGQTLLLEEEESKTISFPQRFLDKPSLSSNTNGLWYRKEKLLRNSYYYYEEHVVSSSPTRDLCYGNMERLAYKKFCHSEMPSVSLEPSEQPTATPHIDRDGETWNNVPLLPSEPSPLPTASPTTTPSSRQPALTSPAHTPFPTNIPHPAIGLCAGDCDSPADCESGLYCYQRMNFEAVPGCPGTERDGSRKDYCTDVIAPSPSPNSTSTRPPTDEDSFRLKLYWNSSYWWQESNEEIEWCMACPKQQDPPVVMTSLQQPVCHEGDVLFLHYCSNDDAAVYFDFVSSSEPQEDWVLIQVVETELCLERKDTSATLEICNGTNPLQHWAASTQVDPFEIAQRPHHMGWDMCLTTHHHPKLGEEIELYPCDVARNDNSSLWVAF
jgi:hypothetical protein